MLAPVVRLPHRRGDGLGPGAVSLAPDHDRGAVSAGWRCRPHRPSRGRGHGESLEKPGRRREQDGRGRRRRDAVRGDEQARRLHLAPGALVDLDHSGGRQALRPAAGIHRGSVRADRAHLRRPDHPRGARRQALEDGGRLHRGCEKAARADLLQLLRRVRHAPHGDGAPVARGGHQAASRAVRGRGAGPDRHPRRPRRRAGLGPGRGPAAHQGGQAPRARRLGRQARRRAARGADVQGARLPRRRVLHLGRPLRAARDPGAGAGEASGHRAHVGRPTATSKERWTSSRPPIVFKQGDDFAKFFEADARRLAEGVRKVGKIETK